MSDYNVTVYVFSSIILFLIFAIGVFIFLNQSQNKIIKIKLLEQQNELKYQKNLLINTVKTQEAERNRIAAELHDDVASKLNIIHLNVHLLKQQNKTPIEVENIIDQIETSIKSSLERTRSISHELMPQILKKFGINHALKEMTNMINITEVLQFSIQSEHLLIIKDDFKLLHIYRIIQELVNNTLKYAKAKNIKITFTLEGDMIIMQYSDDGIGYNVEKVSAGLGLGNIKTRSELLDGSYQFFSPVDGKGMSFLIKFPNNG